MRWALVLGGAECVFDDAEAAIAKFGEPDVIVGVKDIVMEYPRIDHWCTFHVDRVEKEIAKRRSLGYSDPKVIWTYANVRLRPKVNIPVETIKVRGGSSGLLGAMVAVKVADKAILAGIPMNENMGHFNKKGRGGPWREGRLYKAHWKDYIPTLRPVVRSMQGWTMETLGAPSREWLFGDGTSEVRDTASSEATAS